MKNTESKNKGFEKLIEDQPAGIYELAEGLTAEEMKAVFFNEDALVEQPEMIYRINGGKHRYYYKFDAGQEPIFFTSVTTMIKQTMPTSQHLIKWIADMGYQESRNYAQERADYGTFMHIEIAELLIGRKYDTDKLKDRLKAFIGEQKLPVDFINHADELKKDLLAFAQFMIECKVKPLAIEVVLAHPTDGYAGAIDLVCEMTQEVKGFWGEKFKTGARAGQAKETKKEMTFTAIIDFKSGRKGFYEEHEIQLQCYEDMWLQHFPKKPIDRVFNWSPKEWRGSKPTYNLKDQSNAVSRLKLPYLLGIAAIESSRRRNTVTIINGMADVDAGLETNVTEMTLSELVKKRKEDNQKPVK